MAVREVERPVFNERVKEILQYLAQGMSSEEVAEKLGYSNEKSMKTLMYRWNFRWDKDRNTYVPKTPHPNNNGTVEKIKPTSKASIVIEMMKEPGFNLEELCKKAGFKDHREIAEYMTAKGYIWSPEISNYVRKAGKVEDKDECVLETEQEQPQAESYKVVPMIGENSDTYSELLKYLPLLEMLEKNKEKLLQQFTSNGQGGTIPRYIVPGRTSGKTIQMSDNLQDMAVTFCNENNIKQRELFEVALIEFFKKYGYEFEMDSLLRSN